MTAVNSVVAVGGLLSAFGLSSAAGLNACLPLLAVGVLSRLDHLTLAPSYASLRSTPVLIVLAVLFVVDVVGDKIPTIDHLLHAVGIIAYPVAGAIAFASQAGVVRHLPAPVALLIGLVTAGTLHTARAAIRPAATATTMGLANPIVSSAEDVMSGILTFLALAAPVLAAVLAVLVLVAAWRLFRRLHRALRWFSPQAKGFLHPRLADRNQSLETCSGVTAFAQNGYQSCASTAGSR
jgi:Domain of unknown function (DUF4126)